MDYSIHTAQNQPALDIAPTREAPLDAFTTGRSVRIRATGEPDTVYQNYGLRFHPPIELSGGHMYAPDELELLPDVTPNATTGLVTTSILVSVQEMLESCGFENLDAFTNLALKRAGDRHARGEEVRFRATGVTPDGEVMLDVTYAPPKTDGDH